MPMGQQMQVAQLMTKAPRTCSPGDSLAVAAQLMWNHDCGCLPVVDGKGALVAMLTDRDICMATWLQGCALQEIPVEAAMSRTVASCTASDSLIEAQRIMREARVRRLPVLEGGSLVGVLSLADLARMAERLQTHSSPVVTGEEVGLTLAGITEPPRAAAIEPSQR